MSRALPLSRGSRRRALVVLAVVGALAALVALGRWSPGGPGQSGRELIAGRGETPAYAMESGRGMASRGRGVGADISWPECRRTEGIPGKRGQGKPMPPRTSRFVVLGLTNGPAFHANPCLARQVAWVKRHRIMAAAYAVTTNPFPREVRRHGSDGPFPDGTRRGRLANTGYQQAVFNLATMEDAGLESPVVWIDVEDSSLRVWPRTPRLNRAVVTGLVRGYRDAGVRVGVYSTPMYWSKIMGTARLGLPEWRSAGPADRAAARARCAPGSSFQGGPAVLAQWWVPQKDFDVACPAYSSPRTLRAWFHRW